MELLSLDYWLLSTIFILIPSIFFSSSLERRLYFYTRLISGLATYLMFNWLILNCILNHFISYLSIYFYVLSFLIPLIILMLTKASIKQIIYYSLLSIIFYYLMLQLACLYLILFNPENFFEYLLIAKIAFTLLEILILSKTKYFFISRETLHDWRSISESTCAVIIAVSFNSLLFSILNEYSILIYLFQLCSMVTCLLFVIFQLEKIGRNDALQANELARDMLRSQKEQHLKKVGYVELINFKYHQLKHLISIFDESTLNAIDKDINNINLFETGNAAVDIALFEINSHCIKENIRLTSMIDVKYLEMVDVIDLYAILNSLFSIFLNMSEKPHHTKFYRKIDIKIYSYKQFIRIRLENNLLDSNRSFDYDNYYLKNTLKILEKYDGYLTHENTASSQCIKILIPLEIA